MKTNVGSFDRAARQTIGIMMSALGFSGAVPGLPGKLLIAVGLGLIATGTAGRCLIYRALGWSTVHPEQPLTSP